MKSRFFVVLLSIFVLKIFAQGKVTGIYYSATDYTSNKAGMVDKHKHVKLHDFFYKHYIEIIGNDTTLRFEKDSIFGFVDEHHTTYRFHKKSIYPVLHFGALMLYKIQPMATKNGTPDPYYYFSKGANTPVLQLTKSNLAKEFSDNSKFLELLEAHFQNDYELHLYDDRNVYYLIDHILQLSRN